MLLEVSDSPSFLAAKYSIVWIDYILSVYPLINVRVASSFRLL